MNMFLKDGTVVTYTELSSNFLLVDDENCILEREPLENLVKDKQLSVYQHNGFWGSMDTYKDVEFLREIWEKEKKWKIW